MDEDRGRVFVDGYRGRISDAMTMETNKQAFLYPSLVMSLAEAAAVISPFPISPFPIQAESLVLAQQIELATQSYFGPLAGANRNYAGTGRIHDVDLLKHSVRMLRRCFHGQGFLPSANCILGSVLATLTSALRALTLHPHRLLPFHALDIKQAAGFSRIFIPRLYTCV